MLAIGTRMAGSPRTVSRHAWARPGAADAGAGYARALRALTPFAPALARCKRSTYARAAAPPHWAALAHDRGSRGPAPPATRTRVRNCVSELASALVSDPPRGERAPGQ